LTSIGDPWLPVGPGAAPALTADPMNAPTNNSVDWSSEVDAYDFDRLAVNVADEVATVTSDTGPWAVGGTGDALIVSGPATQSGCVRGECVCPDGLALAIPQLATNGRVAVGVTTTDTHGTTVTITVSSVPLASACDTLPHRSPPPTGAPPSDLGCMVGQWSLTDQTFADQFVPAIQGIHYAGGVGGRHLDIAPDGAYVLTDDGSDPSTGHGDAGGVPVTVVVALTGRVDGEVQRTSPTTATFASNTASIDMHARENVAGTPINFNQHFNDAAYFGNGDATVTCDANSLTTAFANATFTYTKD